MDSISPLAGSSWTIIAADLLKKHSADITWQTISQSPNFHSEPFAVQQNIFQLIYPDWHDHPEQAPAWIPSSDVIKTANITQIMQKVGVNQVSAFRSWATNHFQNFWAKMTAALPILFKNPAKQIVSFSDDQTPSWFPGATLNIADSCFTTPGTHTAITYLDEQQQLQHMSYQALNDLSNRVANGLIATGCQAGDVIGIAMPMNKEAIAIYLGIIKMGGVAVTVPDSFSSQEMLTRFNIANTKLVFTQDVTLWSGKHQPLYTKVKELAIKAIVSSILPTAPDLRPEDKSWEAFLSLSPKTYFDSVACDPMSACHILFSSGTTGEPKAIVWNHTTPIKAATDAYLHQNIKPGDVLAWPTSLGWMMGPWLVFAALINHASMALYTEAPKDRAFGEFIQNAQVTMLGVVPTLVAYWHQTNCMQGLNWQHIKAFSSTGECSNPDDMLYLMSLAGYKPVIEYCGGTEIGGAYLSSTMVEKNYPSLFTGPTMGLNICILDEAGHPSDMGEVAIIPPSIGLSTTLLNADHQKIYFSGMPTTNSGQLLRRHGDQIKRLPSGHYSILGRADDTMNLGGIKISAAEIERALSNIPNVSEIAAIAVSPPDHGPSLLVIYAATASVLDKTLLLKDMQKRINTELNPLFKIYDVVIMDMLPKTASNKIMRKVLRNTYQFD